MPPVPGGGTRALAGHTVVVAGALGVAQVLAYLVSVVAARALGPVAFGALAAMLGLLLIGNVAALGLQAVAARRLVLLPAAERPPTALGLTRLGLAGGVGIAAVTALLSPVLAWVLRLDGVVVVLLVAATLIPLTWLGGQLGVAQGGEDYPRLAAVYLAAGVGRGVGGIIGALAGQSTVATLIGIAAGTWAGAILGRLVISPLLRAPMRRMSGALGETLHATHALLALFVLTNIDVLLARALLSAEEAGQYGVGAVIAKVAFWLPQFVGVIAFPRLADARRTRAVAITLLAVGGLGAIVVAGTAVVPGLVVGLAGGPAYAAVIPLAWMFAAIGAAFSLAQALLLTRLAVDDRRAVIAVWTSAVLLAVLATVVLPRTIGGLATSTLVAGTALCVVGVIAALAEHRSRPQETPAR